MTDPVPARVVVGGGGFAGVACARKLAASKDFHVTLSDRTTLKRRCVIWGGGLMAAPIAGAAGLPQGRGGRIDVQPDFTVAGFPGVLIIGDIANIPAKDGAIHPQLGSVALQSGSWAAKTILADRARKAAKPFSYRVGPWR